MQVHGYAASDGEQLGEKTTDECGHHPLPAKKI